MLTKAVSKVAKTTIPKTGQLVRVRNRPGIVRNVQKSGSENRERIHFVTVEYIDGWRFPETDSIIWEREPETVIYSSLLLPDIDDPGLLPDDPGCFDAFLNANRWTSLNQLRGSGDESDDIDLVSPWHSAVQIEDYQLYPVMKALMMPRINLLLADDVGLGKTIEAGLIINELFARGRIRRVLILCPASLQRQWQEELKEKFHMDFEIVDRTSTFKLQRELGIDTNPWATFPRIITSMDYLAQQDIQESFRAASEKIKGKSATQPWQMLVVDEVHNFTPSRFGDESRRCGMLRFIASFFEHRLFLTATPHNGFTLSFTGLLELLDPVRFKQTCRLEEKDHNQIRVAVVRRLKSELPKRGKYDRFGKRFVKSIPVNLTKEEKDLYEAFRAYRIAGIGMLQNIGPKEKNIGEFLFTILNKRLLSSVYAFARTWWRHVEGLNIDPATVDEVNVAKRRVEEAIDDDSEKSHREEDAVKQGASWLKSFEKNLSNEMNIVSRCLKRIGWGPEKSAENLDGMTDIPLDGKWKELRSWIRTNLIEEEKFRADERLIVFTEYRDTLNYIITLLKRDKLESPHVKELYGGVSSDDRSHVKNEFNDSKSQLRILAATDTASEGINLQNNCRYVIHYEIPWNPMRLEQRNGRVDRHGQARDVSVFHFTSDDEADMKFLYRIAKKVEQVREDLGNVGKVIDNTIMENFTANCVSVEEMEKRVDAVNKNSREKEDLKTRDIGSNQDYERAIQRLKATELKLGLTPDRLAETLEWAMAIDAKGRKGDYLTKDDNSCVYRMTNIPSGWDKSVKESLSVNKGGTAGARRKLAFDPEYFEKTINNRRVFKPEPDTALMRLGHPLMKKSLGILKNTIWEKTKIKRWTLRESPLPHGLDEMLIFWTLLEVTNELRETCHEEVNVIPFIVSGESLSKIEEPLWRQVENLPRHPFKNDELSENINIVRDQWIEHKEILTEYIKQNKKDIEAELNLKMKELLKKQKDFETKRFALRLRDLDEQRGEKFLRSLREEIEQRERELGWGYLPIDEIVREKEQILGELKHELVMNHLNKLRELIEKDRDLTLEKILPARYKISHIDLHPLAVEYVFRATERRGN